VPAAVLINRAVTGALWRRDASLVANMIDNVFAARRRSQAELFVSFTQCPEIAANVLIVCLFVGWLVDCLVCLFVCFVWFVWLGGWSRVTLGGVSE
jgi:hypothetical protein